MMAKRRKAKQPTRVKPIRVWVGFCDDVPHWTYERHTDEKILAVYASKRAAKRQYADARPMIWRIDRGQ